MRRWSQQAHHVPAGSPRASRLTTCQQAHHVPAGSPRASRLATCQQAHHVPAGSPREGGAMSESEMDPRAMTERWKGTLGDYLGIEFEETSRDRVVARLTIRDELRTVGGALHGGTLMAFADTIGAVATVLNLPAGAGTTTLESKTNFFAAGRSGLVRAESTPLHRGKRTMVWQTKVTDESGRMLSLTTQAQMVLT